MKTLWLTPYLSWLTISDSHGKTFAKGIIYTEFLQWAARHGVYCVIRSLESETKTKIE